MALDISELSTMVAMAQAELIRRRKSLPSDPGELLKFESLRMWCNAGLSFSCPTLDEGPSR